jgi:predicted O-linked N-acetylglucosamine transferase (SPINDLY family)
LLDLWGRLLATLPRAKLLVIGVPRGIGRERTLAALAAGGARQDQVELLGRVGFDDYWRLYHRIDIALDAHPYNGATTTCEALWMGVPVVSLAGSHGAARSGASLLAAVGLEQLLAQDTQGYLQAAQSLASDASALAALRAGLRERMRASPLRDEAEFVRAFEALLAGQR